MKILLFGANGQVGWELQRSLAPLGELIIAERANGGDLSHPEKNYELIKKIKPDVIVNAAAYTAVDKAESESQAAELINTIAPKQMAIGAKEINALLIHYSTDYVFDGSGNHARKEDEPTSPLNVYGLTKQKGEEEIAKSGAQYLIFRTSWVYSARGANFAKTMLKLASQKESLSIINDQIGAPTGADLIADITAHAIKQSMEQDLTGIYHLTASGHTSWYEYANFIFQKAKKLGWELKIKETNAISTNEYPTPAKRPLNSKLNCEKLEKTYKLKMPAWQKGIERMLEEITNQSPTK